MTQSVPLLDASGAPIRARDIARVRTRAVLSGRNPSPWAYDAQQMVSQEMDGWLPFLRGPDTEINYDRDRVVARARDLIRNDGWAGGAINRLLDAAIGAAFRPVPAPNFRVLARANPAMDATWAGEFSAAVAAEWRMWADCPAEADATQQQTMTQLLRLAFRHKLVDGDALGCVVWAPERAGRYATTLQVLDPDRLSNPFQRMDTHSERGGVVIDGLGAAHAYYIRRAHQNDWFDTALSMIWDTVPRATNWGRPVIVHDFDRERADQHRGNGLLTAVLARFKMLSKFDAVSLQAAVLRTMVGFFLKSPYDAQQIRDAMEAGPDGGVIEEQSWYQGLRDAYHDTHAVTMGGVRMPALAPGESIETATAAGHAQDFEAFEGAFLRSFAAATGQSVQEVSGDFREVNYSSYRGAMLMAWRTLIRRRMDFVAGFASPVYGAWLEEALESPWLRGLMPRGAPDYATWRQAYAHARWIGPGQGWVDPVKERQGAVLGLDAGFGTLADVCATVSGEHWREVLDEREVEEAEFRRRGLTKPDWAGGNRPPAAETDVKPQPE